MAAVNESNLLKSIRTGEYSGAYYFYGRDVHGVETFTRILENKLVDEAAQTYNLHRFNGKNLDLSALADCVEALPLFSERICVSVNDLNAEALSAGDLKFLLEMLDALPDSTALLFYMTGLDITDGKKYPTPKNKKLLDAVAKKGTVCEFAYKKPAELVKSITEAFKKRDCAILKANAEYLAELCLSDTVLLYNEIEKLAAYAQGKEITAEIIDLLVSKQLDSNVFALAKAVASSDAVSAMSLLDELFFQRAEPVAILSAISMPFVDLYRAKTAVSERKPAADVTADFGYKANRSFAVTNAFRDVRHFSIEKLRTCLRIMAETDFALKSSHGDGRILIEKAVVQMMQKSR